MSARAQIAAAAALTVAASCSVHPDTEPVVTPAPVTAGQLDDRDVIRLWQAQHARPAKVRIKKKLRRRLRRTPVRVNGTPGVWLRLAACETNTDWRYGGPDGHVDPGYEQYDGGFSFMPSTWNEHGGREFAPYAWGATPAEQIIVAKRTLRAEGVNAWPQCGPRVGLSMSDAA